MSTVVSARSHATPRTGSPQGIACRSRSHQSRSGQLPPAAPEYKIRRNPHRDGVQDFETVSFEHVLEKSLRSPIALDQCDLGRRLDTTNGTGQAVKDRFSER